MSKPTFGMMFGGVDTDVAVISQMGEFDLLLNRPSVDVYQPEEYV